MAEGIALLRLMQVASASFPIGAFAYSQGLEGAIDRGWVTNEEEALAWIGGQLGHLQAHLEVPFLVRFYQAWPGGDQAELSSLASAQIAFREARELRDEDTKLARSMLRTLGALGIKSAAEFSAPMTWAGAFALAGWHYGVPLRETATGFLYAFCENQVVAASRLIPLGQQAAQRVLSACLERVPLAVELGLALPDDELGFSSPAHALSCIGHEHQYSRLFLS